MAKTAVREPDQKTDRFVDDPVFWWVRNPTGGAIGRVVRTGHIRYRGELFSTSYGPLYRVEKRSLDRYASRLDALEWVAARVLYKISDLRLEPKGLECGLPLPAFPADHR